MEKIKQRLEVIDIPCSNKVLLSTNVQKMIKTKGLAKKGIVSRGALSEEAIQRQLHKALHGQNVTLYILGESVSVGADLGKNNKRAIFHNILSTWWDSVFKGISGGSKMLRRNVAVGGVGSSYFGRCWEEYLSPKDKFDMAIWEFNINDISGVDDLAPTLELFTRKFFKYYQRLDLMISIFYRRSIFEKRHEIQEEIHAEHARKYNLTCLNIEPLLNQSEGALGREELVSKSHPSKLAHLQMAFLMMDYYTEVMLRTLKSWIKSTSPPLFPATNFTLPCSNQSEVEKDLIKHNAVCWTAVTPDYRCKYAYKHSLFQLAGNLSKGFLNVTEGWKDADEERYDLTGGYQTRIKGAVLKLNFATRRYKKSYNVSLALRSWKANSVISVRLERDEFVKTNYSSTTNKDLFSKIIKSGYNGDGLIVYSIDIIPSGYWTLTMKLIEGDFLLCALMLL